MFEGKPPFSTIAPESDAHLPGQYGDEQLLAFSWHDLLAKLNAARDLRAVLAHVPETARASFDAIAAQHLTARTDRQDISGKQAVNPVVSANSKDDGATEDTCADGARSAIRGVV